MWSNADMNDPVAAVRALRSVLGDTLQKFAGRLGLSISAITNYEGGRTPTGRALVALARVAEEANRPDLAAVFDQTLKKELGLKEMVSPPPIHRQPRNEEERLLVDAALMVMNSYVPKWREELISTLDRTIGLSTAKFFREHLEKQHELWPRFLQLMLDGKTKAEACRELGIPEGLFKVTEEISGQGTVRRDILHLPGGGTRLIEVTITDGSPPAASEEPQGTAEGEEWSVPK